MLLLKTLSALILLTVSMDNVSLTTLTAALAALAIDVAFAGTNITLPSGINTQPLYAYDLH